MPVSVVVGGQFGSEGKGKTSLHIARRDPTVSAIIRVGGSNSGHTGVTRDGRTIALRQLPAGAIDGTHRIFLPAGSYIDIGLLLTEIDLLGYDPSLLMISPHANVITDEHKAWERETGLRDAIGSTESGTGAAVLSRVARGSAYLPPAVRAEDHAQLAPFLGDTVCAARELLEAGRRIIIEGTQGFGLSMLHADAWPKATSRDTTAAGFLAEAGLSPFDVDDVTLVLRCHPIRVAGRQSGPLPYETSWEEIAKQARIDHDLTEYTTVTNAIRRVGAFDAAGVRQAIKVNCPTRIVLNHLDYVSPAVSQGQLDIEAAEFVKTIASEIGREVDWVGTSPSDMIELAGAFAN
jgi:adenylosuccinate synthase